jgi:F0F1-type ATP synthase membrane subunit b/b'
MKKILRIAGIVIVVLLGLLVAAPFFFKDEIKALVQDTVNESLNAEVYFGEVGLSFFRNFPNVRLSVADFGVINQEPFAGDTLVQGKELALVVNLFSLLGEGPMEVQQVLLSQPDIRVRVLADGRANWDIVKPDTASTESSSEASSFSLALNKYAIEAGRLSYDDQSLPMYAQVEGLDHSGSGDFSDVVYELRTQTQTQTVDVSYDGLAYLSQSVLNGDIDLKVDVSEDLSLSFLDNQLTVNDLTLAFAGEVAMPGDDIALDMTFSSPETDFRSILSLVPGVFTEDFGDIQTAGQLAFDGYVKGVYRDEQLPGFGLNLLVKEGRFQYPDLPKPVENISTELNVDCPDGDLEKLHVLLKQLHADLGSNPIDAQADVKGLERMQIRGKLKADLNLAELTQIFPIEGTVLRGMLKVDADANGVYHEASNRFPQVKALMAMENGYVKNEEYPAELSELQFRARLEDADGSLSAAKLDVPDFHFLLDGEPLDGSAYVENFDDPFYRIKARGKLDLEKLMQIYPIDSMTLRGQLTLNDFETEGRYSDLEAERYDRLQASGSGEIYNLYYSDLWYVQPGFTVDQGSADFTADKLIVKQASGKIGQSDYRGSGYLDNYLAFGLMPDQPLGGKFTLQSNRLDVNEWMVSEKSTGSGENTEEEPWEVIPVPDYLDFEIDAQVGTVVYDDLELKDFSGKLIVAKEELDMANVRFGMLGSRVSMNGLYNTQSLDNPTYNFYLDLSDLAIEDAYNYFSPVKAFAPALAFVNGVCNTELGLKGHFKPDMTPVLEDLNGLGKFVIKKGEMKDAPMFSALAEKTKLSALRNIDLKDIKGNFEIKDGFLIVAPIDLEYQGIKLRLSGRQNLAGGLDYAVRIDAPSGTIGNTALTALSDLSGGAVQTSDRVVVNLNVGGTAKAPKITGTGGGTGEAVKEQLTDAAEEKLKKQTGLDVNLEKDSLKAQAGAIKKQAVDSAKKVVENAAEQAKDSLRNLAEEKAKEAEKQLEDKVRDQVGDSVVNELKNLKDRFGLGKKKKKN